MPDKKIVEDAIKHIQVTLHKTLLGSHVPDAEITRAIANKLNTMIVSLTSGTDEWKIVAKEAELNDLLSKAYKFYFNEDLEIGSKCSFEWVTNLPGSSRPNDQLLGLTDWKSTNSPRVITINLGRLRIGSKALGTLLHELSHFYISYRRPKSEHDSHWQHLAYHVEKLANVSGVDIDLGRADAVIMKYVDTEEWSSEELIAGLFSGEARRMLERDL